jgi:3-oxoacyl-[acyl-carrier protein] reductase
VIGEGRVAIVTGGGRGIGRAVAVRLGKEGADVAISYRSNDATAEEAAEAVRATGARCEIFKGDVASPEDVAALFKGVGDAFGQISILVNNAGVTRDNLMMRMKEVEFDDVLRTNLKGTYLCTRAALRPMIRARWGRIVNVSSVVGIVGNAGQANYAASRPTLLRPGTSRRSSRVVCPRRSRTRSGPRYRPADSGKLRRWRRSWRSSLARAQDTLRARQLPWTAA